MWPSSSVSYMFEMMLDKKGILRPVLVRNATCMMHRGILYKRGLQEDLAATLLGSDRWLVDVLTATLTDRDS